MQTSLPEDLLVLPSHQSPFYGLHTRLAQIIKAHHRDLQSLYNYLTAEKRAVDCFPALFKQKIHLENLGLATGETLAHLNYLIDVRRVVRSRDEQGVDWYQKAD